MRISVSLCGEKIIDWKVDCDNSLPDGRGKMQMSHAGSGIDENILPYYYDSKEIGYGKERICVLPKDKYRLYNGAGSWQKSWTDTIAVTR